MGQLHALRLAEVLRNRLVDFSVDDAFVRDQRLTDICRRIWGGRPEDGGLVGDLWVEGAFPAQTSDQNLDALVEAGSFPGSLRDQLNRRGVFPGQLALYTHQDSALRLAFPQSNEFERPALAITAPAGAGKTEAFLLPVLADLMSRPPDNAPGGGISCLILYPMNALVHDQVERLYDWLQGQDLLTLFHFTSETPEDHLRANQSGTPRWEACRMRTRQQARGLETAKGAPSSPGHRGPVPNILITNYSMLEYMLSRPQDAVFFGPSLRSIILDEAHLYSGTLAAEITLLLRRLMLRCNLDSKQVLQFAKSATLGTGNTEELKTFVATLFDKPIARVSVIVGETAKTELSLSAPPPVPTRPADLAEELWVDQPLVLSGPDGKLTFDTNPELCTQLRVSLPLVVSADVVEQCIEEDRPAALLAKTLGAAPLIHALSDILFEVGRIQLRDLAQRLWKADGGIDGTDVRATVTLLHLASMARLSVNEYPIVPHRIHLMARPSQGLSICMSAKCPGPEQRRLSPLGTVAATSNERCDYCSSVMLGLARCRTCGEWLVAGDDLSGRLRPPVGRLDGQGTKTSFLTPNAATGEQITLNLDTGEKSGAGGTGIRLTRVVNCPNCGSDPDTFQGFTSGEPLSLAILAETALASMPEYPSSENLWLPARGRRLLAFSDSRAEAARLGPRLTRQHEIQLARAAIVRLLLQQPAGTEEVEQQLREDLEHEQAIIENTLTSQARRQLAETRVREYRKQLRELVEGPSMAQWAERLALRPEIAEIMDRDSAWRHEVRDWKQEVWEQNRQRVNPMTLLFQEFASPYRGAMSAETMGNAEVTYPGLDQLRAPAEFVGLLPTEASREDMVSCWPSLLATLCDTMRRDGAITSGNTPIDETYELGGGLTLGRWMAENDERGSMLQRFVGVTNRQVRRKFAADVLETAGVGSAEATRMAPELLSVVFRQLHAHAARGGQQHHDLHLPWLETAERQTRDGPPVGALRIVFPHLGLRRPPNLWRCPSTGQVWPRSVLGYAPANRRVSMLQPVTEVELDRAPRYGRLRREYLESEIFGMALWAEEHSAQLATREARRLQDLFRTGKRNVLSATTTLELGIDIGGLNGVLMSNVPPGKANYLQRAGRVGRRSDGSSIVLTFARLRPYDQAVFHRLGDSDVWTSFLRIWLYLLLHSYLTCGKLWV